MKENNLEQTTEEIYLSVTEAVLKKNMKDALDKIKKTKEPESFYEKTKSAANKQANQYKTQILYAGIITGLAAAAATAGALYYFLAN